MMNIMLTLRKMKKKNRKLKPQVKILLFILIIALVVILFFVFKNDDKKDTKKTNNNEQTENNNKKEKPTEPVKPKNKYEDGKYYLEKNLERYENYDNANPGLGRDEVIKRVNSGLDKTWYVDVEPTDLSKGNLVIVNKLHYVDQNFEPDNLVSMSGYGNGYLVKDAHDAYVELYNAAKADGMNLIITTSYRNYGFQSTLYNNYVRQDGQESADTYSARPGYSEHQTDLAVDLSTPNLTNAFI